MEFICSCGREHKWLTTEQAARRRGVHLATIALWRRSGLPFEKAGRDVLIKQDDLDNFKPNPPGNPQNRASRQ